MVSLFLLIGIAMTVLADIYEIKRIYANQNKSLMIFTFSHLLKACMLLRRLGDIFAATSKPFLVTTKYLNSGHQLSQELFALITDGMDIKSLSIIKYTTKQCRRTTKEKIQIEIYEYYERK